MLPLESVKVLDLSEGLVCSLATMYLTRYGAEVVKVESPKGDKIRSWEPVKDGESLYFQYLNNGKKSIVLDAEDEMDRKKLKNMLPKYDIVCVNVSEDRWGISYEETRKLKEDIIYAGYSLFGMSGCMSNRPGSSLVVQALGVAMDMTGVLGETPIQSAPSVAEHYAAGYLTSGILLALIDKKKRGIGQKIDISLQDAIFSCIEAAPAAFSSVGEVHTRKGNFDPSCAPYDTFETSDGYVAVGVATEAQWVKFCDALRFDDLKNDERFKENEGRRTDYLNVLRPLVAEKMIHLKKLKVEEICRKNGIPCCAVLNVAEITDMPNTKENGFLKTLTEKNKEEFVIPQLPFQLSDCEEKISVHMPEVGENSSELV